MSEIKIKSRLNGWHTADPEQAQRYIRHLLNHMQNIPDEKKSAYIESHYLRGTTVKELLNR